MPEAVITAHIPLVRIEQDLVRLPFGELVRLPFDAFNAASHHLFADWRGRYETAAPVFYQFGAEIIDPADGPPSSSTLKVKVPPAAWFDAFRLWPVDTNPRIADVVFTFWTAMQIAFPHLPIPSPQLSTLLVGLPPDMSVAVGGQDVGVLNVIGDADQELLFSDRAAFPPLSTSELSRIEPAMDTAWDVLLGPKGALAPALIGLAAAGSPMLTPEQAATLAVMQLEDLVGASDALGGRRANRLARLVQDPAGPDVEATIDAAFQIRHRTVHAENDPPPRGAAPRRVAEQILASTVTALASTPPNTTSLEAMWQDALAAADTPRTPLRLTESPVVAPPLRLRRSAPAVPVDLQLGGLGASDTVQCFTPLVGIDVQGSVDLGVGRSGVSARIDSVPLQLLALLVDKDIRREMNDLFAQAALLDESTTAALITSCPTGTSQADELVVRERDVVIHALRLAGQHDFIDPTAFGRYVFEDRVLSREPTILRQTFFRHALAGNHVAARVIHSEQHAVVMEMPGAEAPEPEILADLDTLRSMLHLVRFYADAAPHPKVEYVLGLLRRVADWRFTDPDVRAFLAVAALEAMLGRFPARDASPSIEDLAEAAVGSRTSAVEFFNDRGRPVRNEIAHGDWSPNDDGLESLDHFGDLATQIAVSYVRVWTEEHENEADPGDCFTKHLNDLLMEGRQP